MRIRTLSHLIVCIVVDADNQTEALLVSTWNDVKHPRPFWLKHANAVFLSSVREKYHNICLGIIVLAW